MQSDVVIVLQQPERAMNIGAVARAMKNAGITSLRLVDPVKRLDGAYRMATNAVDVLDAAQTFGTLREALADVHAAYAVTRRGDLGDGTVLTPRDLAGAVAGGSAGQRIALVFGPEHRGLSNAEIGLCTRVVSIPSHESCPSLNLSHAVMVLCHEIYFAQYERPAEPVQAIEPAPEAAEIETILDHAQRTLLAIGFLKAQNPGRLQQVLRSAITRASLSRRELRVLRGVLSQIDWVVEKAGLSEKHG
ncbi:MAG: RNA methyltransferase [Myxococcota bacterium]|jgi:tRNA/rRNA methyltransferase